MLLVKRFDDSYGPINEGAKLKPRRVSGLPPGSDSGCQGRFAEQPELARQRKAYFDPLCRDPTA
jgi:hypothetical protein